MSGAPGKTVARPVETIVASAAAGVVAGVAAHVAGATPPMPVVVGLTAAGAVAAWRTATRTDAVGRTATFAVALVMAAMAWFAPHGALERSVGLPDGVAFAGIAVLFGWLGWTHDRERPDAALPPSEDP